MQSAGGIKRLSAAVTVASQAEGSGADRKVVSRSPEELEKLRRIVASAIGIQIGAENTRGDTIALEELPFNDQLATSVAKEFDQQQKHEMWWGIARGALYPGLALVALLVLLRLFKRTPVQEIQLGVPVGRLMAAHKAAGNGHGAGAQSWGAEAIPGVVTVDVLNRLIKENPSNMTQAIREWMDKGRSAQS
jgi:flagellar biosynthesis/type III secretory pathway M-ring protein FliF/YscJ